MENRFSFLFIFKGLLFNCCLVGCKKLVRADMLDKQLKFVSVKCFGLIAYGENIVMLDTCMFVNDYEYMCLCYFNDSRISASVRFN